MDLQEIRDRKAPLWQEGFGVDWDGEVGWQWGVEEDFYDIHC